ncbi:MAG: TRC40/GET3/ArsA family transport-energizing ATPase [Chloroflexi bacterium]|nr:TRC40/GET3/ArsA family transport-energizing ATPase [Chloroflexota bacterium]
MRILVHSGKGGVGKTSISAATALRCAEYGLRTLVMSTDTAHSLADSLGKELGPTPIQLQKNLWGQEVDARYSIEKHWGELQKQMVDFFRQQGMHELRAEEITILPGLDEIAHLLWLQEHRERGEVEVLIVDAAPTAETLRLLSMPDVTQWWFERLLQLAQGAQRWLQPISRMLSWQRLPEIHDRAIEQAHQFFHTLERVRALLSDPEQSSVRLVINAESMIIKETQRMHTYLCLYGYPTDAIICNRLLPPQVNDPFFRGWREAQGKNLALAQEVFGDIPILKAPMFGAEVSGLPALRQLAAELYGDEDPSRIHQNHPPLRWLTDADGSTTLVLSLPFASYEELDLLHKKDDLTVRVGKIRRNIALPYALWQQEIASAKFQDSALRIRFEKTH